MKRFGVLGYKKCSKKTGKNINFSHLDNIETRAEGRPSANADADKVPGVLADCHHSRGDSHPPE